MKMAELFTREKAEEGIKVAIFTPAGEPTDQWLIVRGIFSGEYRRASESWERRFIRAIVEETIDPKTKRAEMADPRPAALVKAWSLDEECTPEAVETLMREAPQIADMVKGVAEDRKRFYASESTPTSDGSTQNVALTENPPQEAAKP